MGARVFVRVFFGVKERSWEGCMSVEEGEDTESDLALVCC